MIRLLVTLLALLPATTCYGQTIKTSGPCSPIATNNHGSITINCPGVSQEQSEQVAAIMNKVLAEKLDFKAVMDKLDEILHEVNPNAPKTTYTYYGMVRMISPGRVRVSDDPIAMKAFERMGQLDQSRDYSQLVELAEQQIRERPDWLTSYFYAGYAYNRLGQVEKARERLEVANRRIAGNPDYEPLQKPLNQLLEHLRTQQYKAQ